MTLTEFLKARIAEDEAVARAAAIGSEAWRVSEDGEDVLWWPPESPDHVAFIREKWGNEAADRDASWRGVWIESAGEKIAPHIARHDPARVLAECNAKRAVIDWHRSWPVLVETPPEMTVDGTDPSAFAYRMTQRIMWATEDEYRKRFGTEPPTAPMLRALAAVYADHPDYRQEWA